MAKRKRVTNYLTPKKGWQQVFIARLAVTGNVTLACEKAKVSRAMAYHERQEDPQFASAWEEAIITSNEYLEAEARRRAHDGVLEPVFHKGVKCGAVRKYSDTLLIFLMKGNNPSKYRDNPRVELTGANGTPIQTESKHDVSGTITAHAPDIAAIAATLGRLGLPCPGPVPSDNQPEPVDRGTPSE